MTTTPAIWTRPDLSFPAQFDTIFFDVDGVLIKTTDSFRATDIAVAEYVAGTIHGLDWGREQGLPLVTMADVDAFKQAGGYNNDWDMCYLLASLFTARLREWRGTALGERSISEWAALTRAAHLEGHGGREWVDTVVPESARVSYQLIGEIYHETYWGADELQKRMGREPRHVHNTKGLVHNETMLYAPDFFWHLREVGIVHMGMITGRIGPEVDSALERIEAYSGERWWEVVVPADQYAKPDPQALRFASQAVSAHAGLYIGDTADDFDLVRRYRLVQQSQAGDVDFLAAMVAHPGEVGLYQERGADIILANVEQLLDVLSVKR